MNELKMNPFLNHSFPLLDFFTNYIIFDSSVLTVQLLAMCLTAVPFSSG